MSDVDVSYKARRIRLPTITMRDHEGPDKILIELEGYPLMYARDLEDLKVKLDELGEREAVRTSYKKG